MRWFDYSAETAAATAAAAASPALPVLEVDLDIEKGRREVGGGETGAAQPRCGAPLLAARGDPAQPGAARVRVLIVPTHFLMKCGLLCCVSSCTSGVSVQYL